MTRTEDANFGDDSQKQNNLSLSSLQIVQFCMTNKYSLGFCQNKKIQDIKEGKMVIFCANIFFSLFI